jgi:hypothetical protein
MRWSIGFPRRTACLSLLQIERVEAFGEPPVDRSKQIAGLIPLALIAPEAGEIQGRTHLPKSSALRTRHIEPLKKAFFRCSGLAHGQQQRSSQPMHFRLSPALSCHLDHLDSLIEMFEGFVRLACNPVNFRKDRHVNGTIIWYP